MNCCSSLFQKPIVLLVTVLKYAWHWTADQVASFNNGFTYWLRAFWSWTTHSQSTSLHSVVQMIKNLEGLRVVGGANTIPSSGVWSNTSSCYKNQNTLQQCKRGWPGCKSTTCVVHYHIRVWYSTKWIMFKWLMSIPLIRSQAIPVFSYLLYC